MVGYMVDVTPTSSLFSDFGMSSIDKRTHLFQKFGYQDAVFMGWTPSNKPVLNCTFEDVSEPNNKNEPKANIRKGDGLRPPPIEGAGRSVWRRIQGHRVEGHRGYMIKY